MHEYWKFFGTNNQQKIDRFLIYERDLLLVEKDLKEKRLKALFKNFTAPELSLSVVYASRQHLPRITQEFIAFMIENLDFYLKPQN